MSHEKTTLELAGTIAPVMGWNADATIKAAQTFEDFIGSEVYTKTLPALKFAVNLTAKAAHPINDGRPEDVVDDAKKFLAYLNGENSRRNTPGPIFGGGSKT